jgi:hypothetical protein
MEMLACMAAGLAVLLAVELEKWLMRRLKAALALHRGGT